MTDAVTAASGRTCEWGPSAEAEKALGSYMLYNRLVGESDGGDLLPPEDFVKLKELAKRTAPNRLFVSWTTKEAHAAGHDCYLVGPDSRCFCGHSYKAHAWWDTKQKRVACRCPDCECKGFQYVNGHGTWWIKCECKHGHEDHRANGVMGPCQRPGCNCQAFYSPFSCVCGAPWGAHRTIVQTRQERLSAGMAPVENLLGASGVGEAAAGGITRFTSLLTGVERRDVEKPLPMTDVVMPALHNLDGKGITGAAAGRAIAGMAPVREHESVGAPATPTRMPSAGGGGTFAGKSGLERLGGERTEGSPLVVDERGARGRSWCAAACGGGETRWSAAKSASDALADALQAPEAAPIRRALAEAAGGEALAGKLRGEQRGSKEGRRSRPNGEDTNGHVMVASSNLASQLQAVVAKMRGEQRGGGRGEVLVGKRGSMEGRNGLPVVLEPLPPPPSQLVPSKGQGRFRGGGLPGSVGGRLSSRGGERASKSAGPTFGRGQGRHSSNRFHMKLTLGGVSTRLDDGGGDENGESLPLIKGGSSRHLYGGASGVRGMDVDQGKLQLSQAFWGGYGRAAKGRKPPSEY